MHTQKILTFLADIGLPVHERSLAEDTFLPGIGIGIERGELVVDRQQLAFPGDLLHEAGHIAVTAPSQRHLLDGDLQVSGGDEMAAIAWSYAAAIHLEIEPAILFHEEGYKGDSDSLIKNFGEGNYFGVPLLEYYEMTRYHRKDLESPHYPKMHRWLRASEPATQDPT